MTSSRGPGGPLRTIRRLRRAVLARRRMLAALLALLAVLVGFRAARPPAPATQRVVVAAHDLAGGQTVRRSDLRAARVAPGTAPAGHLTTEEVVGRTTTTPVRAGAPLTDVRLVGRGLLRGYPGRVALPVRIPDPGTVALLQVGDRVDLLATDPGGQQDATTVAVGTPVLAIPQEHAADSGFGAAPGGVGLSGRLVVLAVTPAEAARLAGASVRDYLTVIWSH